MTSHDRCIVDTYLLEVDLFGKPMSPSVEARAREIDEAQRIAWMCRYGGSRAFTTQPTGVNP